MAPGVVELEVGLRQRRRADTRRNLAALRLGALGKQSAPGVDLLAAAAPTIDFAVQAWTPPGRRL
jgi:hypothetical protein